MPDNGKTGKGSMDPSWTQIKKTKEAEWIKRSHTAFPYDINDKLGQEYHLHTTNIIALKFPSHPRFYRYVRGKASNSLPTFWSRSFIK